MDSRWALTGLCTDFICASILIQQCMAIWKLSRDFNHLLIDAGIVCGGLFLLLVRSMVFQAFQRKFQIGDTMACKEGVGIVESINLLFSILVMEDGTRRLFWNLETQLDKPAKSKYSYKVHGRNFDFPILLSIFDVVFCALAIIPIIGLLVIDTSMLAIFSTAAINGAIYMILLLSAQIGILRLIYGDESSMCSDTKKLLYQGIFFSLAVASDGYMVGLLNASSQVELSEDRYFGPYI